jgi:hypothetical protein
MMANVMSGSIAMHNLTMSQRSATVRAEQIPERFDLSAGQTMHFPEPLLAELERYASQLERSVGWCLWMAWCIASLSAHEQPIDAVPEDRIPAGEMLSAKVVMPLGTWRHLTREAERLDRSKSWLLTRGWVLARERFIEVVR